MPLRFMQKVKRSLLDPLAGAQGTAPEEGDAGTRGGINASRAQS